MRSFFIKLATMIAMVATVIASVLFGAVIVQAVLAAFASSLLYGILILAPAVWVLFFVHKLSMHVLFGMLVFGWVAAQR